MKSLVVDSAESSDQETSPKSSWLDTGKFLLNTINHVFIGFVFIYTMWVCWKYGFGQIFTWHAILCLTGFHVLMAESILLFYSGNTWSQALHQPQRRTLHWVLQVVGSVCVVVGIALEFYWRDINNKLHFHDPHSILGLVALILLLLSMTNGLGALYSIELRKRIKPLYVKAAHHFVGLSCFVIGMAAIVLAYDKRIFRENSTPEMRTTLKVFTVLAIFLTVPGALKSLATQLRVMFR